MESIYADLIEDLDVSLQQSGCAPYVAEFLSRMSIDKEIQDQLNAKHQKTPFYPLEWVNDPSTFQ